jgi:hypothetical protein
VAVVTGHFFNDGLRRCMAEVGADFFFLRSDLRTAAELIDFVMHPDRYRRGVPPVADKTTMRALGVTQRSRVSELVLYAARQNLEAALDPDRPERPERHSRRWSRHRQAIAEASGIEPVNLTTGDAPRANQRTPSWRQLSRALTWASKTTDPTNTWPHKPPPRSDH